MARTRLTTEQRLHALQAGIINAVWASEIERHFESATGTAVVGAVFDWGIRRFCQQAAIISTARLLDRSDDVTSLRTFLTNAVAVPHEFKDAAPGTVAATARQHLAWIESDVRVIEVIVFRNKQIAHLTDNAVADHFAGRLPGANVDNILEPTIVEKARELLDRCQEIVAEFSGYYGGQPFDVSCWRDRLNDEFRTRTQNGRTQEGKTLA